MPSAALNCHLTQSVPVCFPLPSPPLSTAPDRAWVLVTASTGTLDTVITTWCSAQSRGVT